MWCDPLRYDNEGQAGKLTGFTFKDGEAKLHDKDQIMKVRYSTLWSVHIHRGCISIETQAWKFEPYNQIWEDMDYVAWRESMLRH